MSKASTNSPQTLNHVSKLPKGVYYGKWEGSTLTLSDGRQFSTLPKGHRRKNGVYYRNYLIDNGQIFITN